MMKQLVYKDKLYLWGNIREVLCVLKEHKARYKTVKQLLDTYTSELK